jgi:Domain of unknown function (DUF4145)
MERPRFERHPKVNPPRIATCPHCGNRTPHELLHRADYAEPEDLGGGDFFYDECWFAILQCGTCQQLSLYVDRWNERDGRWEPALAYPQKFQAPPEVPEAVAHEFDQAISAQQQAPGLAAVAVRRVLEAIAMDQGAQGDNLGQQIRSLADDGKIPLQLADMMNASRTLGNLGAHHTRFGFNEDDVKTVIDFARTLFEYLYVAPAKVEAFRKSVAERKS